MDILFRSAARRAGIRVRSRAQILSQRHSKRFCYTQASTLRSDAARTLSQNAITVAAKHTSQEHPFSVLTTRGILRSLLISTISSRPWLLTPVLHTLNFLCQPMGGWLLNVDKNPILKKILRATFYNQFCAGENARETKSCAQELKDLGFEGVILTYGKEFLHVEDTDTAHVLGKSSASESEVAKEAIRLDPQIAHWKVGIMETIDSVSEGDYIAFKLTGAGNAVTEALAAGQPLPTQMLQVLDDLCSECKKRDVAMIIDAESQDYQIAIDKVALELMRKHNRGDSAVVYNTYQAYLKKTTGTVVDHLKAAHQGGFTLGLKVVRGAYILTEERSLIHDTKSDTDDSYNGIAQGALMRQLREVGGSKPGSVPFPSVQLLLCSHNWESLNQALRLYQQRARKNLPTTPVTFAQLHGMSDLVSFSLLKQKIPDLPGPRVLKCSTWGSLGECLAYLVRRAVENQGAVVRTSDEHQALKQELWRRIQSTFKGPKRMQG